MGHAGPVPPDQPASGSTRTMPRAGAAAGKAVAERVAPAGTARTAAPEREAPAGTTGTATAGLASLAGAPGSAGTGTAGTRTTSTGTTSTGTSGTGTSGTGTTSTGVTSTGPAAREPVVRHLLLLAGYLAAGIAVSWPRVTYLWGRLPATRDAGGYVWDLWWVARQVSHAASPWSTRYLAAPVGTTLGFHTLMPLPGLLLTPVTLLFGPSASYNLISILCPGLLCYLMYRAARLWLPATGAIAAGAFFGLSPILAWRSWYEVNLALGALFLPMGLEAAVRLRRRAGVRQAVILGVVLGAAVLTDQESAVLAAIPVLLVLAPWLLGRTTPERTIPERTGPERPTPEWPTSRRTAPGRARNRLTRVRTAALAALVAAVVASPQLIVLAAQSRASRVPATADGTLDVNYVKSGAGLGQLFAPSPHLAHFGLRAIGHYYYQGLGDMVVVTFGASLTVLALIGIAVSWRRRSARLLALFWLGCAALSLGSAVWIGSRSYVPLAQVVHGVRLSAIMPFTWFTRIPGLSTFREADRFTELGLLPVALLAGAAVEWLRTHAAVLLVPVLACTVVELGWSGNPGIGSMPTALPALDGPIAAHHSASIVVNAPFGIRGGLPVMGDGFAPESMVLATADGHPLADAFVSRIPAATLNGIASRPFYAALLNAQGGPHTTTGAGFARAAVNARQMNVGWVLVWRPLEKTGKAEQVEQAVLRVLRRTGFTLAYRADNVLVYHPAHR